MGKRVSDWLAKRRAKAEQKKAEQQAPPAVKCPTLSATMIVRNEEKNIGRLLMKLVPENEDGYGIDEIVIVDTGSTDRTKEIALGFGPKVKYHDVPHDYAAEKFDFAKYRNISASLCSCDYHFIVDADDDPHFPAWEIKRFIMWHYEKSGGKFPDFIMIPVVAPQGKAIEQFQSVRVYRAATGVKWIFPVHNTLDIPEFDPDGKPWLSTAFPKELILYHTGYIDPEDVEAKYTRSVAILEAWQAEKPDDPHYAHYLARMIYTKGDFPRAAMWADISAAILENCDHREQMGRISTYFVGAMCNLALGRFERSKWFIDRGFQIHASYPDLHVAAMKLHQLGWGNAVNELQNSPQAQIIPFATARASNAMQIIDQLL